MVSNMAMSKSGSDKTMMVSNMWQITFPVWYLAWVEWAKIKVYFRFRGYSILRLSYEKVGPSNGEPT